MSELVFKIQPGIAVDPSKTNPVNQTALSTFKEKVTDELKLYIDRINACGGKAVITVNQDGQTFSYQLSEMRDSALFAQIVDELHSR